MRDMPATSEDMRLWVVRVGARLPESRFVITQVIVQHHAPCAPCSSVSNLTCEAANLVFGAGCLALVRSHGLGGTHSA